jgi:hypothetical protein
VKFIRDREDARFLPSRHHFAIFRLVAWVKLLATPAARPRPGLALVVDRDQSAIEHHLAGWAFFLTTCAYMNAALSDRWNPLVAAILAIAMALVVVEIPMFALGALLTAIKPGGRRAGATSIATFLPLLLASVYYATKPGWPRLLAWSVLVVVAANLFAASVLWLLRDRVRDAERRFAA